MAHEKVAKWHLEQAEWDTADLSLLRGMCAIVKRWPNKLGNGSGYVRGES